MPSDRAGKGPIDNVPLRNVSCAACEFQCSDEETMWKHLEEAHGFRRSSR